MPNRLCSQCYIDLGKAYNMQSGCRFPEAKSHTKNWRRRISKTKTLKASHGKHVQNICEKLLCGVITKTRIELNKKKAERHTCALESNRSEPDSDLSDIVEPGSHLFGGGGNAEASGGWSCC